MPRWLKYLIVWLGLGFSSATWCAAAVPVFVDATWLESRLNDPKIAVIDISSDVLQHMRFHLSGAKFLPFSLLIDVRPEDKAEMQLDDKDFIALLGGLGITRDMHVVIYDDTGGLHAGRFFLELERIGHPKVSVLNGGLVAWALGARKLVNTRTHRASTTYVPAGKGRRNTVELSDVRAASQKKTHLILDVRTAEEYLGDSQKLRSGHIPGAVWWPWEEGVDLEGGFLRRSDELLSDSFKKAGATEKRQPILLYCASGRRAAQSYLVLRSLGFENVKVYLNSMNEYAAEPSAPLKTGPTP